MIEPIKLPNTHLRKSFYKMNEADLHVLRGLYQRNYFHASTSQTERTSNAIDIRAESVKVQGDS